MRALLDARHVYMLQHVDWQWQHFEREVGVNKHTGRQQQVLSCVTQDRGTMPKL